LLLVPNLHQHSSYCYCCNLNRCQPKMITCQRGEDVSKQNWCYDVLLDLVDLLCPLNSGKESYLWFSTECVIHWPGTTYPRLIRRNFMKWQFLPEREVNLLCAVFYYFLIYARLFLIHEKQFPKVRKMEKSVVFWTHVFKVKVFVMNDVTFWSVCGNS
jgi:hypothetical protein